MSTQRINNCLWFDGQAEEAANYYTSIFKNSRIVHVSRYTEAGQEFHKQKPGTALVAAFELDGQKFQALNGGPQYRFTEAMSLVVNCENQDEIDYYWDKLSAGGDPKGQVCGWLKDKYGVSWQVVPVNMGELLSGPGGGRATEAMMRMKKLDIAALERARDGE
jgi:predicted 3-demethylubiquinone-9 3-methyltransferase (glyoxalase superfamily)